MLIIGYTIEKSKCLIIYNHNIVAPAIHAPDPSNHQFVSSSQKKDHAKLNLGMRFTANFKQTCPPERKRHCIVDSKINFHMMTKVQKYDSYFQIGYKTKYVLCHFVLFPSNRKISVLVYVADTDR